ncbi:DUF2917 domain-containing protein [Hydrogenophaga sp. OTU3427]|uniref:DUF2917 domain-containing protein n=1 Tax=Hydrogenophaga sp. OTU3427 TaxID=3043856 RepID=UPI00313DE529
MTTATAPSFLAAVLGLLRRQARATRTGRRGDIAPTRLLPGQARTIHAAQGTNLQVLSGRLWLTQPGATQDVFLTAGDSLALTQDWVVIEADAMPDAPRQLARAEYLLRSL